MEYPRNGERRAEGQESEGPGKFPRRFQSQLPGQLGETAWKICKAN